MAKSFFKKIRFRAVAVIFAVFALAMIFFAFSGTFTGFFVFPGQTPDKQVQLNEIKGCTDLDRASYNIPKSVFEALPTPPKCFVSIANAYIEKKFSDDFFFSKEFFLQPEFYPNFQEAGLEYWRNPSSTHYGAIGFGAFPSTRQIEASTGQTTKTRFFFHSGFGVRAFQGLALEPEFENPLDAQFVELSIDAQSSKGFLLGPNFPKFTAGWAKAVDVQIKILPNAEKKLVKITLKTKAPGKDLAEQWKKENSLYYNATDFVGEQAPMQILLQIS